MESKDTNGKVFYFLTPLSDAVSRRALAPSAVLNAVRQVSSRSLNRIVMQGSSRAAGLCLFVPPFDPAILPAD